MSEAGQTAAKAAAPKGGRSFLLIVIVLLLVLVAAGGGAAYMFLWHPLAGRDRHAAKAAAPLPFYLEVKPFVASMGDGAGAAHFVQLGVTLSLSGPALGPLINAVLPEVEDAMRQTVLAFKVDDITTPAGVDKLRKAMTAKVNRVLLQQLGAARIKGAGGGRADAVRNIYFTTLIIE